LEPTEYALKGNECAGEKSWREKLELTKYVLKGNECTRRES